MIKEFSRNFCTLPNFSLIKECLSILSKFLHCILIKKSIKKNADIFYFFKYQLNFFKTKLLFKNSLSIYYKKFYTKFKTLKNFFINKTTNKKKITNKHNHYKNLVYLTFK